MRATEYDRTARRGTRDPNAALGRNTNRVLGTRDSLLYRGDGMKDRIEDKRCSLQITTAPRTREAVLYLAKTHTEWEDLILHEMFLHRE